MPGGLQRVSGSARIVMVLATLLLIAAGAALFAVLGLSPSAEIVAPDGVEESTADPSTAPDDDSATSRPSRARGSDGGADVREAATLRGVVKLYRTREPVVGLDLVLTAPAREEGAERQVLATRTDREGVFRFTSLHPAAGYELAGHREPYAPIDVTAIDLTPAETTDLGTLWLEVPVDLPVLVIDSAGIGIEGADVSVFASPEGGSAAWTREAQLRRAVEVASTPRPTKSATTGSDGAAVVEGLLPGNYHVVATAAGRGRDARSSVLVAPDAAPVPLRLMLPRGYGVEGRVTDPSDALVVGAQVIATPTNSSRPGLDKVTAESGDDGKYVLEGLGAGRYRMYLAREDAPLEQVGEIGVPDTRRYDIHLRPTGVVYGTVTDTDGAPVHDAEVQFAPQGGAPIVTRTAEDGTYRLESVPAGPSAWFGVVAEGYVPYPDATNPRQGQGESLREGSELRRDVVLERGLTVQMRVVAADDGAPIESARVRLMFAQMWGNQGTPREAMTDAEGAAEVQGLLPGSYLVVLNARGFVQPGMPPNTNTLIRSPQAMPPQWRLDLGPEGLGTGGDSTAGVVTYRMTRGATVTGLVRDPDGETVKGVQVTVTGAHAEVPSFTNDAGEFEVPAVEPRLRATATATPKDGPPANSEPFVVEAGKPVKDVEIDLLRGGRITGKVRTSDGSPVEDAFVRVAPGKLRGNNPWQFRAFDKVDRTPVAPDGSFEITGVVAGDVTVRADADGYLPAWDAEVTVVDDQETGGVDLIIERSTEISGRVESPAGEPVAGAKIGANYRGTSSQRAWNYVTGPAGQPTAQSDAEGRFVLRGLKPGKYVLYANARGWVTTGWVETATGGAEVLLTLKAGTRISGVVKDEDGQPLAGAAVSARNTDNARGSRRRSWGGANAYTAPDGSFEFRDLAEGAYDLTVSGGGWGRQSNVETTTEQGVRTGRDDVEIIVKTGATISGNVVDDDGEPVGVGWVNANFEGQGGGGNRWSRVQGDGTFSIVGLSPGTYRLQVYGSFQHQPLQGVSTGSAGVELKVERGFSIRGFVTDAKGLGLASNPGIQVRQRGEEKWQGRNVTQPGDGTFTIGGLQEGAWDLVFRARGMAPVVIENVNAGTEGLAVVMRTGLSIQGTVVDAGGNALRGNVQAQQLNPPPGSPPASGYGRCDENGEFTVESISDGEYRLVVRANKHAPLVVAPVPAGSEGLRYALETGTTVTGTVKDANEQPLSGARLQLVADDITLAWSRSGDDGRFEFQYVPTGGPLTLRGYVRISGTRIQIEHPDPVEPGAENVEVTVK